MSLEAELSGSAQNHVSNVNGSFAFQRFALSYSNAAEQALYVETVTNGVNTTCTRINDLRVGVVFRRVCSFRLIWFWICGRNRILG